ncbi:MAG: riboflavin synthase [Eubacteriaceae bacterium]|jgi:riboflavin synthase
MFTGIVEEIGKISEIRPGKLNITASIVTSDIHEGDSIAVNGVCLTASKLTARGFTADVMPETMRMTCLGKLKRGSGVNLERAMAADGRFGGHILTGHIDGTGTVRRIRREGNAVRMSIAAAADLRQGILNKGSVAVDGVSLTVAALTADGFEISLIPHTGEKTILLDRRAGDTVNIETDVIGKYVRQTVSGGLSESFLKENGFA